MKPGSTESAWISPRLRAEATATRKTVFLVRASRGELWMGSKGSLDRWLRTSLIDQDGARRCLGGLW